MFPSYSIYVIKLKVPQGTGSIFEKTIQKSPPSSLCSVLAELFLARAVALPSRYTKKKEIYLSTWTSNYTRQTAMLSLLIALT